MEVKKLKSRAWDEIKSYFNIMRDMVPQSDAEFEIRSGVSFKGSQLLVLIFAIFVASLGLNTNSIPVIIGAMLISPLMGPIYGIGLGIAIEDFDLVKRGLKNIGMAVLGALLASALYFCISPVYEGAGQLSARTSPGIYDVLIALFGGAAGMISIGCKNKGQVMPGVAIATSLMPPLCTAGYGLATLQFNYFFGALYLFFINTVFILFASWVVLKLMRYKRVVYQDGKKAHRVQMILYVVVTVTIIGSAYLTFGMIEKSRFIATATDFVNNEMVFPNTQVLRQNAYVKNGKKYIDVNLIGQSLSHDSLMLVMMPKLDSVGLNGVVLNIKQGFGIGTSVVGKENSEDVSEVYNLMQRELMRKDAVIDSLRIVDNERYKFNKEALAVTPELKVLFPHLRDIALSEMVVSSVSDVGNNDTVNVAFIRTQGNFSTLETKKLKDYLQVRLKCDEIRVLSLPSGL